MANKNAKSLYEAIPECISGCFDISVANTGCATDDYDCWCYKPNHQTIVDTLEQCLSNKERKTKKKCTEDDEFEYENSYWKICEQYWEPYGTATEPTSFPTAVSSTASAALTTLKVSTTVHTTASSEETAAADESTWTSLAPTETGDSEQAQASDEADTVTRTHSGLSPGGKAAVGVGVALGVILIGIAVFLWLRERKRRRSAEEQLRIVEIEKTNASEEGYYVSKGLYEMEGDRPHAEELRGCMRTPELGAAEMTKSSSVTHVGPVSPSDEDRDSSFSTRIHSWPISPESPGRQESRVNITLDTNIDIPHNHFSNSSSISSNFKMYENRDTIIQLLERLKEEKHPGAQTLKDYINETSNLKDVMMAVVKDIVAVKNDLGLTGGRAAGLNACREELCYAFDKHCRTTEDGYDRLYHPRFTCRIQTFKVLAAEGQVEVVLRIPLREYNDSPHVLEPGKCEVSLIVKEN
ncbi:hypothetical protein FDENT_9310 [Fusarium denticulatum]|uniref:CFEM domain-containing protein n=1 Tax=Fusarium denticulatum TaxID=48507 RepID=A0A8H5TZD8_9HYPO|nr:hypothetical protein FDENT_9310 [Fusarium denticulatum]